MAAFYDSERSRVAWWWTMHYSISVSCKYKSELLFLISCRFLVMKWWCKNPAREHREASRIDKTVYWFDKSLQVSYANMWYTYMQVCSGQREWSCCLRTDYEMLYSVELHVLVQIFALRFIRMGAEAQRKWWMGGTSRAILRTGSYSPKWYPVSWY